MNLRAEAVFPARPGITGCRTANLWRGRRLGQPGQGPTTVAGKGQGPTQAGGLRVPLDEALPRYRAEATRALDTLNLPPALRALIRAYFDALGEE